MSHPDLHEVHLRIASLGVVPVIAIEEQAAALPLADALLEGGLPIAEITFRTTCAAAVIEEISSKRADLLVGAGTILDEEDLNRAAQSGAAFGLAPGFNAKVVTEALAIGFPFSPGVMTPSDIEGALSLGVRVMKFFPAGAVGGMKMLSSITAPYLHKGIRFIPTGGVTPENAVSYLEHRMVIAIGGTWIATREDISSRNWNKITANCRAAVTAVKELRASATSV
jgi:2-dehydro-3-deoxyphosphogluconate aldolase/(4S)-4-hydroxy-2-oxoglutarate aldolase